MNLLNQKELIIGKTFNLVQRMSSYNKLQDS